MSEDLQEGKYMMRRKFYVPKDEVVRDYHRKDLTPADYFFDCDYEDEDEF